MIQRVCIVGAGTIGSLLAAHLSRVVDVSILTRRDDHARALVERGLRVTGRSELVAEIEASADPDALQPFDLGIIACKGTDVDATAARLEGRFPDATMMTIQNGLGAEEVVRRHGDWRLLSSITFMSGTRHSDTWVEYILDTATWIGPNDGTTLADAEEVAELIRRGGLKAEAFADLRPMQWSKLVFNATVNTVAALTGLPHDPHFAAEADNGDLGHLVHDLIREGQAVAAAAGVELDEDPWEMNVHATQRGHAHRPSMLEDVDARRPTEIESITGALVREAGRLGVPVPLHAALYRLIRAKEESWELGR
ncbi:MAG: 2-dehydropantoate 2-reductase [Actinobacteria bacterium]|nr:2-dehydropantoate 2-reductase [Actinomycetota bacterium]